MTTQNKIEALNNAMKYYKFPKKFFVVISDGRIGNKFAIGSNTDNGGLDVHSNYMSYDEFNAYLFGYYDAISKKFKR